MKKPDFDVKKKRNYTSYNKKPNNNSRFVVKKQVEFNQDKLNQQSQDIQDILRLIQAVRIDRMSQQENYNSYRKKLIDDRMILDGELIAIKKRYHKQIIELNNEFNLLKSNYNIQLKKLRKELAEVK